MGAQPHLLGLVVVGGGARAAPARPGPALPSSPRPRAMVQNHCKQIKAVTSLLLAGLQSKEERERKAAILILTEVGAWAGRGGALRHSLLLQLPQSPPQDLAWTEAHPDDPSYPFLPPSGSRAVHGLGILAGPPTSQAPVSLWPGRTCLSTSPSLARPP